MIRHKWIINVRNKAAELADECDSAACIEGSQLTVKERDQLRDLLSKVYLYIDKNLMKQNGRDYRK